jgi:hypothetical protein
MNPPRKFTFWIWTVLATLFFWGSVIFFGINLTHEEARIAVPVFIGMFVLFCLLYLTPAYLWLARQTSWVRFGLTVILVSPAAILSIWLGFVKHTPFSAVVWLAPFLGVAAGMSLQAALGKAK